MRGAAALRVALAPAGALRGGGLPRFRGAAYATSRGFRLDQVGSGRGVRCGASQGGGSPAYRAYSGGPTTRRGGPPGRRLGECRAGRRGPGLIQTKPPSPARGPSGRRAPRDRLGDGGPRRMPRIPFRPPGKPDRRIREGARRIGRKQLPGLSDSRAPKGRPRILSRGPGSRPIPGRATSFRKHRATDRPILDSPFSRARRISPFRCFAVSPFRRFAENAAPVACRSPAPSGNTVDI